MEFATTRAERLACKAILLDPPADQVKSVDFTLSFDAGRFEVIDTERYLGVFSESGTQVPLTLATIGGVQAFEPDPGIDWSTTTNPRAGTVGDLVVNNALGIASLAFDLSSNPTPPGSEAQNFFAFLIRTKDLSPITGIEYFDEPGTYDVQFTSFSCLTVDDVACGTGHPVYGFNLTIPEPSTLALFGAASLFATFGRLVSRTKLKRLNKG